MLGMSSNRAQRSNAAKSEARLHHLRAIEGFTAGLPRACHRPATMQVHELWPDGRSHRTGDPGGADRGP